MILEGKESVLAQDPNGMQKNDQKQDKKGPEKVESKNFGQNTSAIQKRDLNAIPDG